MRIIRSILCASLAMMALAVCASMPAAASVPIDVGIYAGVKAIPDYPAPVAISLDESVIQVAASPETGGQPVRSFVGADRSSFAAPSFVGLAYRHIDPGRMRC